MKYVKPLDDIMSNQHCESKNLNDPSEAIKTTR
jgi:hypothetical protein